MMYILTRITVGSEKLPSGSGAIYPKARSERQIEETEVGYSRPRFSGVGYKRCNVMSVKQHCSGRSTADTRRKFLQAVPEYFNLMQLIFVAYIQYE